MKTFLFAMTLIACSLSAPAYAQITIEPDPDAGSMSVYVPPNPEGVDMCRDFIEHRIGARGQVTLSGRTPENMSFVLKGKVVGRMTYSNDGSERALCQIVGGKAVSGAIAMALPAGETCSAEKAEHKKLYDQYDELFCERVEAGSDCAALEAQIDEATAKLRRCLGRNGDR